MDMLYSKFSDWLVRYPFKDEEGYDGVHNGDFKGLKKDAPPEAVKAYKKFLKRQKGDDRYVLY